jgi:hypothetical protein
MKAIAYFVGALGIIALIVGLALLFAFPLMWLINYVFTSSVLLALFGVPQITFWKTVALSITTGWLFKGNSTSTSK